MIPIRTAGPQDVPLIASHREAMFREMGRVDESTLARMSRNFMPWVEERLASGVYLGWIAENKEAAIASAGLLLLDWPPHSLDPEGSTRGYLLNVFVDPVWRGRGLARSLTRAAIEECRRRHIRMLTLHASDAGRPVYAGMGFSEGNEMQLHLPEE